MWAGLFGFRLLVQLPLYARRRRRRARRRAHGDGIAAVRARGVAHLPPGAQQPPRRTGARARVRSASPRSAPHSSSRSVAAAPAAHAGESVITAELGRRHVVLARPRPAARRRRARVRQRPSAAHLGRLHHRQPRGQPRPRRPVEVQGQLPRVPGAAVATRTSSAGPASAAEHGEQPLARLRRERHQAGGERAQEGGRQAHGPERAEITVQRIRGVRVAFLGFAPYAYTVARCSNIGAARKQVGACGQARRRRHRLHPRRRGGQRRHAHAARHRARLRREPRRLAHVRARGDRRGRRRRPRLRPARAARDRVLQARHRRLLARQLLRLQHALDERRARAERRAARCGSTRTAASAAGASGRCGSSDRASRSATTDRASVEARAAACRRTDFGKRACPISKSGVITPR